MSEHHLLSFEQPLLSPATYLQIANFADIFTGRLISEIPTALKALCDALIDHTELVELNLSDNAFGGRSAEPMVEFLSSNHHFSVLKLNNNGLGIQGGTIVANALIAAADKLAKTGQQSKLRTVICGRNRLENGSAPVWAKAFAKHGGLQEVRMFQNGIRMEGIEALSLGLSQCKNLETLDLQDNTATLRGSRAIAKALPSWPKLKTLNLSDMLLKPKGGALIADALGKGNNKELQTLQLQYDDLDRKCLSSLASAVSSHLSDLTKLEINGNWADEDDECIEAIKKALERHGHEDALDELDEMDPEGEEDEEDEEDEGDEDDDEEADESSAAVEAATRSAAALTATGAAVAAAPSAGQHKAVENAEMQAADAKSQTPATKDMPSSEPVAAVTLPASTSEAQVDAETQSAKEGRMKSFAEAAKQSKAEHLTAAAPVVSETTPEQVQSGSGAQAGGVSDQLISDAKSTKTQGQTEPDELANQLGGVSLSNKESSSSSAATPAGQQQVSGNVDISNELYASGPQSASESKPGQAQAEGAAEGEEEEQQQRRGFKGALGAVKELLFK